MDETKTLSPPMLMENTDRNCTTRKYKTYLGFGKLASCAYTGYNQYLIAYLGFVGELIS